jgi:lipoyl-dependent peroxiredoxin
MIRKGSAVWRGDLKRGTGTFSTESGALKDAAYSFGTRFESSPGSNPEELISAALAGCFSMALSAELNKSGITPESVQTTASTRLDMLDKGPTVTEIHLDVLATVPGVDRDAFMKVAEATKANCPISRLLSPGTKITMEAKLAG